MTPDTCNIQDTNDSADLTSARHGRFQEKEKTPTTELNIFLSKKKFATEKNNNTDEPQDEVVIGESEIGNKLPQTFWSYDRRQAIIQGPCY